MNDTSAFIVGGALVILAAWIPLFLRKLPLSLPMIAIGIGAALPFLIDTYDPLVHYSDWMRRVTEFALIVAVLGAGLKIDRRFSLKRWMSTWRLLLIVMPLSIAAISAAAWWLLALPVGLAIFLGSALAPTDPVLAASVQTGEPGSGEDGETHFALTSEAGLNDGLAYPFVMLGLMMAGDGAVSSGEWWHWAGIDFLWDIVGGVAVGALVSAVLVLIDRQFPEPLKLRSSQSGLVSVGVAFLAYGVAQAVDANGFVAVFCEAVTIRNIVPSFTYSRQLNHASEQFERVVMVLILAFLGTAIWHGLFDGVGWAEIVFAVITLLLVRPVATAIGFVGSRHDRRIRTAFGYFGIRGIASLYYISFAVPQLPKDVAPHLTAVIGLVVLMSVFLYGATADAVERWLFGEPDS